MDNINAEQTAEEKEALPDYLKETFSIKLGKDKNGKPLYAAGFGTPLVASGLMFASVCAFAFSIYLTLLQAFVLKNWCTWCIISACICASIFALDAVNSPLFSGLFSSVILGL